MKLRMHSNLLSFLRQEITNNIQTANTLFMLYQS